MMDQLLSYWWRSNTQQPLELTLLLSFDVGLTVRRGVASRVEAQVLCRIARKQSKSISLPKKKPIAPLSYYEEKL